MGSDGEPIASKKRASAAKDKTSDAPSSVTVGDAVLVQSAEDKNALLEAKVTRKHMSGEVTVEYLESGKTERYVKADRLQLKNRAASKATSSTLAAKGDRVQYRSEDTKRKWREGVVKACRDDGSYDIVDEDAQSVAKKVPAADVKKTSVGKAKSAEKATKDEASDGDEWVVGDRVEFQVGKTWRRGRIAKKGKDGTFDVSHESDEEEIAEKISARKIRKAPAKATKATKERKKRASDEDEDEGGQEEEKDDDDGKEKTIRQRKSKRKKSVHSDKDDHDDDESEDEGSGSGATHKPTRARRDPRLGTRFELLRSHQLVQFQDGSGRSHRGYIKVLWKEDQVCDIEHESDTERVSKRVPAANITTVSMLSRLWGPNRNPQAYPLNSRVYYRTKEGTERKGFVVKICRDEGKTSMSQPTYDIEDELDGDVVRKISASKLRPVPWMNYPSISMPSLPSMPGLPAMPSMPSIPSWTMLRRGMRVRVRRRDEDSKRVYWQDGVIVRLKKDATCVVECLDSDGSKSKVTAKNGDVRPKFTTPFAGLTLPTLQLPRGFYPPKSSVEVLAEGKSKVYMGTIVSVHEAEKTYTILYADGHKEKNVAAHRVRLCLRKLRIGTEVEMIVEGPCKEVSKLDGEVAWVHRNEKVAVRINGGNNDVFAEVCTHAIMVDGQPAFAAPLTSTWLEMGGFYANLSLEIFAFLWLCFGLCVEIGEMARLYNETAPELLNDQKHMAEMYTSVGTASQECIRHQIVNESYPTIPTEFMLTDRAWLLAMMLVKIVLTFACVLFSCRLVHTKISAIQDNYIDVKEYQRARVLRRHFSLMMGFTTIVCFLTLLIYASMLTRFEYFCLFRSANLAFDSLSLQVKVLSIHTEYASTVDLVLALAAKSVFNIFRSIALQLVVLAFPNAGVIMRIVLWLPVCIAVTALVSAVGVAGLHVFYYVQRAEVLFNGVSTMSTQVDWAVVAVLVSLWLGVTIVRLLVATGSFYDTIHSRQVNSRGDVTEDLLDQAERGEFGLQAKREALHSRVELKQEQLGICKLSVLRVERHLALHVVSMILGIVATSAVQDTLAKNLNSDGVKIASVQTAQTLHLVYCILWLVVVLLASMLAALVKREAPELLAYILDV